MHPSSKAEELIVLSGDFLEESTTEQEDLNYIRQRVAEAHITQPWIARFSDDWVVYSHPDVEVLCRTIVEDDVYHIEATDLCCPDGSLMVETNGTLLFSDSDVVAVYNNIAIVYEEKERLRREQEAEEAEEE